MVVGQLRAVSEDDGPIGRLLADLIGRMDIGRFISIDSCGARVSDHSGEVSGSDAGVDKNGWLPISGLQQL